MSTKFITGLVLGAAAGAAIALFLTSDKGQAMMEDISDAANDVAGRARNKFEHLNDELAALLKKGKTFVEDLEQKTREANA